MKKLTFKFSYSSADYYFDSGVSQLREIADQKNSVIITDENVFDYHRKRIGQWKVIVLKPGEEFKVQRTIDSIIGQLIALEADRKTTLVGIGGGVITDITGYVASVYMRGVRFGFVPTTLLSMVDAAIGGKNGIDVGVYKNLVGVTRQPSFILYDLVFLNSLPQSEWINGFAEIIKHACIKDGAMFEELESGSLTKFENRKNLLRALVRRNALLKTRVVQKDEFEKGERRLLNFGHTIGHALENQYKLSHGQAIAIGMTYACHISEWVNRFKETDRVTRTLEKYGLPTYAKFDAQRVFEVLKMDKKRERTEINYVLLEKIGRGVMKPLPLEHIRSVIQQL